MFLKKALILFFVTSLFYSCGDFHKIMKSTSLTDKYAAAEKYYLKGDYFHAQQLFDELITYYRGTAQAEKIYYYYSYCYYGLNDYVSAAYYFSTFVTTYPNSKYTRECQYMSAYCTYLDSPDYSLDQTNTTAAIKELQLYVNMYPKSDSVKLCNILIDELRFKLETKEFEISKMYFRMEDYKSAIVSFRNTLKDYPSTTYKEEILFYLMKANFLYASNSIASKKEGRYKDTIDAYDELLLAFPQTKYLKEAESINKNALKEINKISGNKTT
ncbi:MAG TPA: outer membrane protein assembly factor BamD [Bacteroidales bacterium]|nr:outer membrane protein assembly factor BamD [Bacteroidales bacterium]HPS17814.1 outer membrane protein assembly factor BamD [Bacteroidales bacterium]